MLVSQSSRLPTNKLSAAVAASAVISVAQVIVGHLWPWLAAPDMWGSLYPIAVLAAGYFLPDAAPAGMVPANSNDAADPDADIRRAA